MLVGRCEGDDQLQQKGGDENLKIEKKKMKNKKKKWETRKNLKRRLYNEGHNKEHSNSVFLLMF